MASLENEMKLEQFEDEIKDEKAMDKKLKILFLNEYDELIGDILNLKDDIFIDQVKEGVSLLLEDFYTINCLSNEKLLKLVDNNLADIKNKYNNDYTLINQALISFEKISKRRINNDNYLANFRKHCIHTDDLACHNCGLDEKNGEKKSNFIIVNDSDEKKSIKFVICENCKKVYYSSFIFAHCSKCGVDYYTSILSPEENPELLYATWEKYHCKQIMNERMKCIKCNDPFYLNMKTGLLMCLNKKCEFISKPSRILWTCYICKADFKSGAIPYNPLDIEVARKLVSQTLLLKHKAHPNHLPCCKINVFFTDFHHKNGCDGILYEGELDENKIVVCEKCKAINFFERFRWTCPKCGKRFKDKLISSPKKSLLHSPNKNLIRFSNKNLKHYSENIKEKEREENRHKKEKEVEDIEKRKIKTPKPAFEVSKLGFKREKELKEFKLNSSVIEDLENENEKKNDNNNNNNNNNNDSEKEQEITKKESLIKKAKGRYRRFNFFYFNDDKNEQKNKNEDKNKEEDKEKNENEENKGDIGDKEEKGENESKIFYRSSRSRTTYNREEKKKQEEGKRGFRRHKYENENKDKIIEEEKEKEKENVEKENEKEKEKENIEKEKEKEKETEQKPEKSSPRVHYRRRKKDIVYNKKELTDFRLSDDNDKRELEEKEKKEKEEEEKREREREEKERKEKEEEEKREREREEKERREKEKEENEIKRHIKACNTGGRGWFRRLAAEREKGIYSVNSMDKKETTDKTTKSTKKEKDTESNENDNDNDEDSDGNNSIDNNENNEENRIMKFGNDDSDDDDEKEKKENPIEPDPLYMNFKFKRSFQRKRTRGMEIEGDHDQDDNKKGDKDEEKEKKKKMIPQAKIAMSKIPGVSEHLFNHISKRMNKILDRCKIPVFNIDDYIFNKKLGEGSYAVIFAVNKRDDKENKQLALKKIIAKTLTEIDKFTKEFELVHSCNHPNIMKIYGICIRMLDQTTYALYVLMELSYCDWDKEIKMHIMKKKNYTEKELINILRQLTGALLFMQQNLKISHRDIKPQNVLLFKDGLYKIADFGEAKEAKLSKQMNTLRGTELYMSPALYSGLKDEKNDVNHDPYKSDVFSLGFCFLYAASLNFNLLYQLREIFNSKKMNDIIQQQLQGQYSQTFITILSKMMEVDEIDRFDFPKIENYIEENYDKDGNLKNPEKVIEKKHESRFVGISRRNK